MPRLTSHCSRLVVVLMALATIFSSVVPAVALQNGTSTPDAPPESTPTLDAGPSFVIRPLDGTDGEFFTLEAEAGTTHELTVVLGNADEEPLELLTYVNDAIPMTNGGFAIAEPEVPATGPATWIDYPSEVYDFAPEEGLERTFTVTIPEDAEPGQYIAGISLQTAEPLEVEGSDFFNQIIRKTIAVFIIVPGEQAAAYDLGEPEVVPGARRAQIVVPVNNTGNVLVKPRGELTLRDQAGETVLTAPIAMGSVYAGTTAPLSVSVPSSVPTGDYTLSVDLTDAETGAAASIADSTIAITETEEQTSQFTVVGAVTLAPDANNPAFADVAAEITNAGEPVEGAEVVLEVSRDGELVESYPLVPLLDLPQDTATSVSQRYVPVTGWEPGLWSFVLRVNIVDGGASTTVATVDTIPAIMVEDQEP